MQFQYATAKLPTPYVATATISRAKVLLSLLLLFTTLVAPLQGASYRVLPSYTSGQMANTGSTSILSQPQATSRTASSANRYEIGKLPLSFEPNAGQTDPAARFLVHARGGTFFFTPAGVVLTLNRVQQEKRTEVAPRSGLEGTEPEANEISSAVTKDVVTLRFVGANSAPALEGDEVLPGRVNYLLGNDPSKWLTNIPTHAGISYGALYPGIDLAYEGTNGQLKGTYTVAADADPTLIQWHYEGAAKVWVDTSGDLQIQLADGGAAIAGPRLAGTSAPISAGAASSATLTERAPVAWQEINGQRVPVTASYSVAENGTIGFKLGSYNPHHPLTIDPTIAYSTYLGGSNGGEEGWSIAVDVAGNAYVTGSAGSPTFPTLNAYQPNNGGGIDVFVTKLNDRGNGLIYSTYLGGGSVDEGLGIAVDSSGNAYIAGRTASTQFPLRNAFRTILGGDPNTLIYDGFVTKLNSTGNDLIFSTYLGGSASDYAGGIAVDGSGNSYAVGQTKSTNFPTIAGSYRRTLSGTMDAFVTKFSPSGFTPIYSTYLGGTGAEDGKGIAVDAGNNAYVTGVTDSTNLPVVNAYQSTFQGGTYDAFVTKLNAAGSALLYSTYLGGRAGIDKGLGIAVDSAANAYVAGQTYSRNFPVTSGVVQGAIGGGEWDGFATKLNTAAVAGTPPVYSTFVGGSARDEVRAIALDSARNAYITGYTSSLNFPLANAFQSTCNGCGTTNYDAFVMKLNPTATQRLYSSYLGGSGSEYGNGIAVDWASTAYLTGKTASTNFPASSGAYQGTNAGGADAFVTQLYDVSANAPQANECYGGGNPVIYTTQPSGCGDSVNTASGNYWLSHTDIAIPGRGVPLNFAGTYNSLLAATASPLGYGWTHNYNMYIDRDASNNYLVHQENGSVATFASDFSHAPRVLATLSFANNIYTFTRMHGQIRFQFESVGDPNVFKLRRIIDSNNYTTLLTYVSGLLRTVTEPDLRTLTFTHVNGVLNSVRDDIGGRTVVFGHDANSDLRTVDDVGSRLTHYTYQNHLLRTITDANGGVTTNSYDATGRLLTQVDAMNRPPLRIEYLTGSTRITDTLNLVTVHEYEANRLKRVVRHPNAAPADQAITKYSYRPGTNYVSSVTDPLNHTMSYTWDDRGNLLSAADALQHTTRYTYTAANGLDVATDPDGYTTDHDYDASGNLTEVTRKLVTQTGATDVVISYEYTDRPGDVTGIIDPRLKRWSYSYDTYGYLDISSNPIPFDSERIDHDYDNTGNLRVVKDPKNKLTRYDYNAYNELTKATDALNQITDYTYDNVGNLKTVTDPTRNTITNTYNLNNEVERVTQPDGTYTSYGHDNAGRVTSVDNPLRKVTGYLYEDVLRRVTVTDPLGRTEEYNYDLPGRLDNMVNGVPGQRRTTTYRYYDDDQLQSIAYSDPGTPGVTYTYNNRGLRRTMSDGTGTTTYGYDSLGQMRWLEHTYGSRVDYDYDQSGNLTNITYPQNVDSYRRTVIRGFDAAGRMATVQDFSGALTTFGYDANGNLDEIAYPGGARSGLGYDDTNRVVTMTHSLLSGSLFELTYERYEDGAVDTSSEVQPGISDVSHDYDYDSSGRLKTDIMLSTASSSRTVFDLDAASQITGTTTYPVPGDQSNSVRGYDDANQLSSLIEMPQTSTTRNQSFGYDATGNRTRKTDVTTNSTLATYEFNQANELTRFTNHEWNESTTYTYNGDGLRMTKDDPRPARLEMTWDMAQGMPLLLYDMKASYIYGPGGMLLAQALGPTGQLSPEHAEVKSTETAQPPQSPQSPESPQTSPEPLLHRYYLSDQLGNVIALLDPYDGTVSDRYSYDAYGIRSCAPCMTGYYNPYGYAGQYTDEESDLVYLRARYYDPATQQFISRDPVSGQPYVYANGNPTNLTDPSGNCPFCPYLIAAAIGIGANVAIDVGTDFVLNNANFNLWNSLGNSVGDVSTWIPLPGPAQASHVLRAAAKRTAKGAAGHAAKTIVMGPFSIRDWSGYPEYGVPRPSGPFTILEGQAYKSARTQADAANKAIHGRIPWLRTLGLQIHEVHPVKFGGSPTDLGNKMMLPGPIHRQFNTFWLRIQRGLGR